VKKRVLLLSVLLLLAYDNIGWCADCLVASNTGLPFVDALAQWRSAGVTGEITRIPIDGAWGVVIDGPTEGIRSCSAGFPVTVGDGGLVRATLSASMTYFFAALGIGFSFGMLAKILKRS